MPLQCQVGTWSFSDCDYWDPVHCIIQPYMSLSLPLVRYTSQWCCIVIWWKCVSIDKFVPGVEPLMPMELRHEVHQEWICFSNSAKQITEMWWFCMAIIEPRCYCMLSYIWHWRNVFKILKNQTFTWKIPGNRLNLRGKKNLFQKNIVSHEEEKETERPYTQMWPFVRIIPWCIISLFKDFHRKTRNLSHLAV